MRTNVLVGALLLVVGVLFLFLGYQSSQGLDDRIAEAVTGDFTQSTVLYLVLGAASSVAGLAFLLRK